MPTTDEELQTLQTEVQELRDRVADEDAKRAEAERLLSNDIAAAQLRAEKAVLNVQLAEAQRMNESLAEGQSGPLEAAQAEQERAEAQQAAAEAEPPPPEPPPETQGEEPPPPVTEPEGEPASTGQ